MRVDDIVVVLNLVDKFSRSVVGGMSRSSLTFAFVTGHLASPSFELN